MNYGFVKETIVKRRYSRLQIQDGGQQFVLLWTFICISAEF